jgi:hypothetical protein
MDRHGLLDRLSQFFCRHEFVRDRLPDGRLGQRCMKCLKLEEHSMARIIRMKPQYTPIEPTEQPDFPPPLTDAHRAA